MSETTDRPSVPLDQVEQLWRSWSSRALPDAAPLAQRAAMKTAFMAGAATTLGLVINGQEQEQIVISLVAEMTEYGRHLGVAQAPPPLPAGRVVRLPVVGRTRK